MFGKGQILRKIWICLNKDQTSKMGEILTKTCFSPKSQSYTAKLCFSLVLTHFGGNSLRTSLFNEKVILSEKSTEIPRIFFFFTCFERGKS